MMNKKRSFSAFEKKIDGKTYVFWGIKVMMTKSNCSD